MIFLSKTKEDLKKIEKKIEEDKQKELARMQLRAAREIAMKGFSRYGVRDIFENKIVQTSLLALATFLGLFFGSGLLLFYSRNVNLTTLLFTYTSIDGIPNFTWWIIFICIISTEILVPRFYERILSDVDEVSGGETTKQIRLSILGVALIFLGILFIISTLVAI